jgi:hypothetical protein
VSESNRGRPELRFNDGSTITNFQRFSTRDSFVDPLTHLEFETTPLKSELNDYRTKLQKGEFVTLRINGASQGGFLIQTVHKTISDTGGIKFALDCVSPLVTPYQGSVDPDIVNFHSPTDVGVEEAILKALAPYGFNSIVTDSRAHVNALAGVVVKGRKAPTDLRKLKHQDAQAQHGETCYAFITRIVTRLGVCVRLDVNGTVLVSAPDYTQSALYNLVQGEGVGDRFIGSIEITDTNDDQFSEVRTTGKRSTKASTSLTARPVGTLTADEAFGDLPCKYRSIAAAHKPKVIQDKHARDHERTISVAKLALGIRAHKAYQISGTVDGFVSQTGAVWSVDTVAHVKIDADNINGNFWILEREFTLDDHDGAKTKLKLIPLGSLLLGDVPS